MVDRARTPQPGRGRRRAVKGRRRAAGDLYRTRRLGGDEELLGAKRGGLDPCPDFRLHSHGSEGRIVETDEIQHFTTDRLQALKLYPPDTPLGFDRDAYIDLCDRWRNNGGDRYRAAKQTKEFPRPGGRRAQRSYFDACRDLLAPHLDAGPVARVPAPECDPDVAFERFAAHWDAPE